MANSTALSTALTALAESVAPALTGQPMPAPAQLYAAIIRARDEAHCLEARAADRDASVHRLLAQLKDTVDEIDPPSLGNTSGTFRSRFAERMVR